MTSTDDLPGRGHPVLADLLIRAGRIRSMNPMGTVHQAIAIRDDRIVAVSERRDGLDDLVTAATRVIDDPDLTVLPAFFDTHEHMLEAARNLLGVPMDGLASIGELVDRIRSRAERTPPARWLQTAVGWNEADLAEGRLPTAQELDGATTAHPILVRRGGHVAVANTFALKLAAIDADGPAHLPGVERVGGVPTGRLEGAAVHAVRSLIPPLPTDDQAAALGDASRSYAALGVGCLREALLEPGDLLVYQAAWERGDLVVRARPMLTVDPRAPLPDRLAYVRGLGFRSGFGDDMLRVWGLKLVLDGGVAGAALDAPHADDPEYHGHLNWETADLDAVLAEAVDRGWRVGTHAVGDRAVRLILDAYERVHRDHPGLAPGSLVVEHAFLADSEQRARAIRLGVGITVQHPLLHTMGSELVRRWGRTRAANVMPVREWIDEGALIAAGSDSARPVNPMLAVWGMVTRETKEAGVLGTEHAIGVEEAIRLYTSEGARLVGELDRRGTLEPGRLADLVAYRDDPLSVPIDALPGLRPVLTLVGGRAVHDPDSLVG